MRLAHRDRKAASDENLIPMINVVFLLLIFFMVAGTIRPTDPIDTTPPTSQQREAVTAQQVLYVAGDGALVLDNQPVTLANLAGALAPESVAPAGATTDLLPLALRADASLTVMQLRTITDALKAAGVPRLELVTQWVPTREP